LLVTWGRLRPRPDSRPAKTAPGRSQPCCSPREGTMLDGLDHVNWGRLTHAYGSAEKVPEMIRELRSPDASTRKDAIGGLVCTIFHQGSRYRASAPAVPFLLEVLDALDTQDKERLIDLLVLLAVGYQEPHLPLGFDPSREFKEADELGAREDLEALRAA